MSGHNVRAAVRNHVGRRRNNEDNFCLNGKVMPLRKMDEGGTFTSESAGLQIYAVCDGMGGGDAGEEASFMAVEAISEALRSGTRTAAEITEALQRISDKIHEEHSALTGATVAMIIVDVGRVIALNIGDSRIYSLRNGRFRQISMDHTGYQAHSITQYLGAPPDTPLEPYVRVDEVGEWTVGADTDTVYLLCSDGLTDVVADEDICKILSRQRDPQLAVNALVDAALQHGGKDNITAMVVRVPRQMRNGGASIQTKLLLTLAQVVLGGSALFALLELILRICIK